MAADAETEVKGAASAMAEEPFYFELGGDRLFAFLHRAEDSSRGTIVVCHALAEEKLWSHRVYVSAAREFARAGYDVLRFDMRGEGDSSREFEATTISTRVEDTLRATQVARERTGAKQIVLVGHRFGGTIAALAAQAASDRVKGIAVWDPLPDGADYFSLLLRSNLTSQMAMVGKVTRTRDDLLQGIAKGETVMVDGYGMTAALHSEISAIKWSERADLLSHPALLIEVPKGGQAQPSDIFVLMQGTRGRLRVQLATEPPFWRETRQLHQHAPLFTKATLDWLDELAP
jgi:pimeloyl-ACP methyl ester carboxylesterase